MNIRLWDWDSNQAPPIEASNLRLFGFTPNQRFRMWWCNDMGVFSCQTLGPLGPIEHHLNATAYLSINCWPCPSCDGYFQQDEVPCHKAQIISNWLPKHDNEFTILKWPPQSPDINPKDPFGMWWDGRFTSWMCSQQICSNCMMLSCQYGPKSLRFVSSTLLNQWHE